MFLEIHKEEDDVTPHVDENQKTSGKKKKGAGTPFLYLLNVTVFVTSFLKDFL